MTNKFLANYHKNQRKKLVNQNVTIICNNCVGGVILSDLALKFNTPTINLYFFSPDYIAFLERMDYYLKQEMTFSNKSKYDGITRNYPVGKIEDIEIHFLHYESIMEAKNKWDLRVKRINKESMFIIGSDKDQCTPILIERFLKLPYKNKVFFSSKKHRLKEVIYFEEYKKENQVGDLIKDGYAWYFHFDTAQWLNTGKINKSFLITLIFKINRRLKMSLT